jgi:hypothetical protein
VKVFIVESIVGPDTYLVGVFQGFDDMITKLEKAVRSDELSEVDRELMVTRVELDTIDQTHTPAVEITFTEEGKAKVSFNAGFTLETLRAP